MNVSAIKTPLFKESHSVFECIIHSIPSMKENSIVVITSKIISLSQCKTAKFQTKEEKIKIIKEEADWYIHETESQYGVILTIKDNTLIANAGIDESNANDKLILWPDNLDRTTNILWSELRSHYNLKHLGVIVTDSRITPMRWGTIGVGLNWCGFKPLYNYIGTPDIYGRSLRMTKASHLDGLAAAAVLVMGEGNEQTPLAIIEDIPFVQFSETQTTQEERENLYIKKEDDMYAPVLTAANWLKGGK